MLVDLFVSPSNLREHYIYLHDNTAISLSAKLSGPYRLGKIGNTELEIDSWNLTITTSSELELVGKYNLTNDKLTQWITLLNDHLSLVLPDSELTERVIRVRSILEILIIQNGK